MILIPEQVKALRDEVKRLEEEKENYEKYFKECDKSSLESGFVKFVDTTLEVDNYNNVCRKLDSYKSALMEYEFSNTVDSDAIEYGTEFTILYDDNKEEETYTLVQNLIGLASVSFSQNKNYISVDSNLGRAVIGKSPDENFSYTFSIEGRKDSITITGKIISIVKQSNKDIHFIMSRPKSARISKKNEIIRKKAYQVGDKDTLEKVKEITLSQYNLLKEEQEKLSRALIKFKKYEEKIMVNSIITLRNKKNEISKYMIVDKDNNFDYTKEIDANSIIARKLFTKKKGDIFEERSKIKIDNKKQAKYYTGRIIEVDNSNVKQEESVYSSIWSVYARLGRVNKLLSESRIATPPTDGTIGIGSKVSIMTFEDGQIQNRRVEIINQAVSTELNTDYVEVISPLGQKIIGLKNNQMFDYRYFSNLDNNTLVGNGVVYDINNNMNETLAENPTAYQKKRRG